MSAPVTALHAAHLCTPRHAQPDLEVEAARVSFVSGPGPAFGAGETRLGVRRYETQVSP